MTRFGCSLLFLAGILGLGLLVMVFQALQAAAANIGGAISTLPAPVQGIASAFSLLLMEPLGALLIGAALAVCGIIAFLIKEILL